MKVSFGECIVEGIEEFFKHIIGYLFMGGLGYGMVKLFVPILNGITDVDDTNLVNIYLFFVIVIVILSVLIYYLVTKVAINFIMQTEEERLDRKTLMEKKRDLYNQIPVDNVFKHLGNMFLLIISISIIILSRELSIAFVRVYDLSDHFLVELFLNLIFGYIGINLFFVYIIGPLKVKKVWTFQVARKFSLKMFARSLQFFTFMILNAFLVGLVYKYFVAKGDYMSIAMFKVETLVVEIPVMILLSSLFVLYIIIHVIYTININRVHFKEEQWLIDTEFDYTNKW
ncbi:hypothetical protein [Haloplasma contractile]|uniref:Uncharacterized protein n=1 Tax=Haloplasma contractile SSD-17B TaxID=1033810 RepID=U2FMC5_9MOLU|nr:hypothetical protein [Haloplasma contractile]ERJ12324.1 hypothetical protein HLPCO_001310 [Haloplasma contractile SSD-17B]